MMHTKAKLNALYCIFCFSEATGMRNTGGRRARRRVALIREWVDEAGG